MNRYLLLAASLLALVGISLAINQSPTRPDQRQLAPIEAIMPRPAPSPVLPSASRPVPVLPVYTVRPESTPLAAAVPRPIRSVAQTTQAVKAEPKARLGMPYYSFGVRAATQVSSK